ncbi:MAG: hypothetical protein HY015_00335, partial [Bacteroidetes bacterium]|nr:hypothetical protein [Bacteroidota bacterium]
MKLLIFFLFISVTSFSQTVEIVEPYIRGSLVNGVPKGRWEICDSVGAPGLIVDYSTGKIHFRGVDTSKFLVKEEDGTWQWESLQTPARFFGSIAKLQSHYLKFLADVRFNKIVWLVFEIDIDGKAKKPIIAGEAPNWVQNRIIEAFTLAPNDWIAGISNNKTVKTRVSIPIVNCREDCNDVIEQLKNPLVEHGKALFTISLNSSPTIRFKSPGSNLNSIVTRNALFYFGENEILWSNDDSRILVKSKGIDGTTTQIIKSDSFTVEKTIFSTYHYLIKCNSEDCSEV